MPIFWFVSFVNKIKRIRDKTFYFDVRFRPNLRTRHTTCIHRAGWNSAELHGIHMSELPLLLLGKWVTIGSLSQNLFCQLQAKCEWLTTLESLKKKKKKKTWPTTSTINQINKVLLWAKWIYIYIYICVCVCVCVVFIWGSCLILLSVALASGWFLSLSQYLHF